MPLVETATRLTIEHRGGRVQEWLEHEFHITEINTLNPDTKRPVNMLHIVVQLPEGKTNGC